MIVFQPSSFECRSCGKLGAKQDRGLCSACNARLVAYSRKILNQSIQPLLWQDFEDLPALSAEELLHQRRIAREVLARDGMCVLCGAEVNLQAHHRTYVRYGQERTEDLSILCDACHRRHHGKAG
jgi:uncharacterized protein with PIN domain